MPTIHKQSVCVPDSGLPEVHIIAVDNGWIIHASKGREGYGYDSAVAAFESFESLSAWLKTNIEDNTK